MILKLMIVEIKRYLRSLYYLVVLFILFLIHMLGLKGGVPFLFWGDDFLENVNFICIVLSLLMSVYICDEFSYGTVQNKLYLGYKKSQIYIAEVIACSVCGSSLVLLDSLFYLLGCFLRKQELTHSFSYIMTNTLIFMITIGSVSVIICSFSLLAKKRLITQFLLVFFAIFLINSGRKTLATLTDYESVFVEINEENDPASKDLIESFTEELTVAIISTILSVLINNRIFSIFIVIGLTLLLLYGGKETVHTLNQPVQTTLFSIDGELRDNPLYAEGAERTIHNIHLFSSPYAQANYVPYLLHEEKQEKFDNSLILKNSPYHLEFLITDILGGIFLYLLGSYLFNKRKLVLLSELLL